MLFFEFSIEGVGICMELKKWSEIGKFRRSWKNNREAKKWLED